MKRLARTLGRIKYAAEFTPIISKASICSEMRIVPISEAILEPTFPASISEISVGLNSKIMLWRAAKPIVYAGIQALSMFEAV